MEGERERARTPIVCRREAISAVRRGGGGGRAFLLLRWLPVNPTNRTRRGRVFLGLFRSMARHRGGSCGVCRWSQVAGARCPFGASGRAWVESGGVGPVVDDGIILCLLFAFWRLPGAGGSFRGSAAPLGLAAHHTLCCAVCLERVDGMDGASCCASRLVSVPSGCVRVLPAWLRFCQRLVFFLASRPRPAAAGVFLAGGMPRSPSRRA